MTEAPITERAYRQILARQMWADRKARHAGKPVDEASTTKVKETYEYWKKNGGFK